MGKEAKTNAMRFLEKQKVDYTAHEYPHEEGVAVDGVTVAASMGQDPACVFKTLVTQGVSRNYFVFVIPVAQELDLKAAARAVGEKSVAMLHVADINRVRMYPQYLVLEGDAPATVQLYLDYSRAFIRENCPAEEHAPAPVPAEYLECLIGRNAEEEGIASISKNGVLTAYKPGSFNVSIRVSYNGSSGGKGAGYQR